MITTLPRPIWVRFKRSRAAGAQHCREVATLFGVSVASVVKWSQHQRATGSAAAIPMGRHRKRLLEPPRALVIERLKAVSDLTLKTLVAGARLLFLPRYSPDLNALLSEVEGPIEQMFAKPELLLRKAAERTVEATSQRIGSLVNAFPPHECANYLRNSGYGAA